jgi:hypothetical protein
MQTDADDAVSAKPADVPRSGASPAKADAKGPQGPGASRAKDGQAEQSAPARRPEPPVLPQVSRDEEDRGWGDRPSSDDRDDDWYQRERPPHHG